MGKTGSIVGAMLGMGGTTAYFTGTTDPTTILGHLMRPSWGGTSYPASSSPNSNEIDSLYKLVEGLRRDMHRNSGSGVTVIHGSNGSSAIVTYGGIILVSTLGVAYLRGWKFSDFLYVTRAGMQKSMASINSSVEGLTTRMNNVKQYMAAQVDHIKKRQEDTMKAQGELKEQLDTVGQDIENARDDVAGVHTDLNKLGDNMTLLQQQQSYTSEGIYILCSVVGDLMKNVNHKAQSTLELERYLNRPQGKRLQGLEGLLEEDSNQPKQIGGKFPRALMGRPSISEENPDSEHPRTLPSKDAAKYNPPRRWFSGTLGSMGSMGSGSLSRQGSHGMP